MDWKRPNRTEPNRTEPNFQNRSDRPPRTADYWCHFTAVEKRHVASEETCSSGLISICTGSNYCLCKFFAHMFTHLIFSCFSVSSLELDFYSVPFSSGISWEIYWCLLLSWDSPWNGCSDMRHIKGERDQELTVFFTLPSFVFMMSKWFLLSFSCLFV